jgi:hypothetical protein
MAALADKLNVKGASLTTKMLTSTEKMVIAYYHANKVK